MSYGVQAGRVRARTKRTRVVVACVLAVTLVVGLSVTAPVAVAPSAEAASVRVSGLSASARVAASPVATWYGQLTPAGLCRLLAGCTRGKRTDDGFRLTIAGTVDGLGTIEQPVRLVTRQWTPPRRAVFAVSARSDRGSVQGTMVVALARAGNGRTDLTVRVPQATGTGALGAALVPLLRDGLRPGLQAAVADLNQQRAWSAIRAHVTGRATSRGRVRARVSLTTGAITVPPPVASGRVRVLRGTAVACSAKVSASRARCTYRTGRGRPPGKVRVVVTGRYSNGFPVWHAATGAVGSR